MRRKPQLQRSFVAAAVPVFQPYAAFRSADDLPLCGKSAQAKRQILRQEQPVGKGDEQPLLLPFRDRRKLFVKGDLYGEGAEMRAHRRPYAREQIADVLLQISFESAFPTEKFFRYLDTKTSVLRQTAHSLQHHGHLPHDAQAEFRYLQKMRVRKASDLLCTTDPSISSVAQECGFFDNSHLTSTFKSETGKTPSEFRKEVIINP